LTPKNKIMTSTQLKVHERPQLKVVLSKNSRPNYEKITTQLAKIYTNTMAPKFSYSNSQKETIVPNNCALLLQKLKFPKTSKLRK
jgi:hypothetical protein